MLKAFAKSPGLQAIATQAEAGGPLKLFATDTGQGNVASLNVTVIGAPAGFSVGQLAEAVAQQIGQAYKVKGGASSGDIHEDRH